MRQSIGIHDILNKTDSVRMRRVRSHPVLRTLVQETRLHAQDFILPLFVSKGATFPLTSLPGHFMWSLEDLPRALEEVSKSGITSIILFGRPDSKDSIGSEAYDDLGAVSQAVRLIKAQAPHLLVIADVCLCGYTSHGHCGVFREGDVDNDATLELLERIACCYVEAGVDVLAPSGMMDHAVQRMRQSAPHTPILSYAVKYASSLYGGFRIATECSLEHGGSRNSYQMQYANGDEALREVFLDLSEGADMVMVKPAMPYLDVVHRIHAQFPGVPLGAYQVSGEYAMIKAASEKGWLDERQAVLETLGSIKRAGAQFIITYFAKEAAKWLSN